jgi:hypothetical protein
MDDGISFMQETCTCNDIMSVLGWNVWSPCFCLVL